MRLILELGYGKFRLGFIEIWFQLFLCSGLFCSPFKKRGCPTGCSSFASEFLSGTFKLYLGLVSGSIQSWFTGLFGAGLMILLNWFQEFLLGSVIVFRGLGP